ncbi:MFS transporter [Timonella sp. A28]|uniref:MFS transporter n=1 Tax=Timonella sp. A28 TaxID=3442640 RepID=UPI003EC12E5D
MSTSTTRLIDLVGKDYYLLALVGRMPFAMTVVGVFTLVVLVTDSFSDAGLTSASVGIGTAIAGPFLGVAADKYGQKIVLLACTAVHTLALVGLTVLTYTYAHLPVLMASAFIIGASAPQLAAMSRARLLNAINSALPLERRSQTLNRTMSVESVADELVFVFGPVAVGVLAAQIGPWSPLIAAAALTAVFVSGFALHKTARFAVKPAGEEHAQKPALAEVFSGKIMVLAAAMFTVGMFFGGMFTSLTSFMDELGLAESSGIIYAAMGAGSAVFALAVVLFPARFTQSARWLVFAGISVLSAVFLPYVTTLPAITVVLVGLGVGLGPCLVTIFSLGSARAPHGRSATVMTILSSAIVIGQSTFTAITGVIVDAQGTSAALLVPLAATIMLLLVGFINHYVFRRHTGN